MQDIDILASSDDPEHAIQAFLGADGIDKVLGQGPTKASVLLGSGLQVDLQVVHDDEYAPALVYFTGSKDHNVLLRGRAQKMGLTINEYGIFRGDARLEVASDEEFYKSIGLKYVPPELRESQGEIEAAESDVLPNFLGAQDIKGAFHVHST